MHISLKGLIILLFLPERVENLIILPLKLERASQNSNVVLKNKMRGRDNIFYNYYWNL